MVFVKMIDELSALRRIKERLNYIGKGVVVGIGDDAAALSTEHNSLVLATTDSQVEDVHFFKEKISPKDLGRRALAVAVSDIGAMGGVPRFFLSCIGLSDCVDSDFFECILEGLALGSEEFKVIPVGGNITSSSKLFINITVLGEVEPELVVRRKGAREGDIICLSGTVGDSALGLRILKRGGDTLEEDSFLIERHYRPRPRLVLGRELAKRRLATSMIDVSDGVILDLERITVEHGLGACIYIEKIPLSYCYRKRVSDFAPDPYELALSGGEDYELLFTVSKERQKEIEFVSRMLGIQVSEIGYVTGEPSISVLSLHGGEKRIPYKGFIHLRK